MGAVAANTIRTPGDLSRGNRTVGLGDSIMLGSGDNTNGYLGPTSFFTLGSILSMQRIKHLRNAGVASETVAQMLARLQTDVISYDPAKCLFMGGANDVGASFSVSTYGATVTQIYRQLRAAGIEMIVCSLSPRAGSPQGLNTMKANRWLQRFAEAHGLHFVDMYTPVVDASTGGFLSTYSGDGLHPNAAGARVLGQALSDQLSAVYPKNAPFSAFWQTDPTNLITGGGFNVDTNADGIADNWSVSGAAGTYTFSLVTDTSVKGKWQQIQITVAGSRFFNQTIASGWSVGDRVAFSGRVSTTVEAGSLSAYVIVAFTGGTPARFASLYNCAADISDGRFYYEGVVPIGTSAMSVQVQNNGTGTGTIKVAELSLVNLTTLGLV